MTPSFFPTRRHLLWLDHMPPGLLRPLILGLGLVLSLILGLGLERPLDREQGLDRPLVQ